ncbi:NfeD family protein [Ruegeria jejuensis]|uniref:NfeD family protein n=1 Tax=Ruegeria jejuensis TaxID=3233338 RepID=UPI00355B57B7
MILDLVLLWWVWMAFALVLVILEVAIPGFIFLGFAIGAAITGLLVLFSIFTIGAAVLLLIFAGLSLAAWLGLRHFFALPGGQVKKFDRDIND